MPPRSLLVGSVKPLHLTQTRPRGLEMREIHGARPVVVGEVARLPTVGRGLHDPPRGNRAAGGAGPPPPPPRPRGAPRRRRHPGAKPTPTPRGLSGTSAR